MKKVSLSFVRRAYKNQSGQALVMAALCMVAFMGVAGFTIDIGHAYVVRNQLQISTNAAGLAAAGDVFVSRSLTDAQSIALAYATANSVSGLSLNSGYPQVKQYCVQVLADLSNSKCTTSSSANALQVTEQVSMPTTFMRIFGVNS